MVGALKELEFYGKSWNLIICKRIGVLTMFINKMFFLILHLLFLFN